jgi:hypothetical protein
MILGVTLLLPVWQLDTKSAAKINPRIMSFFTTASTSLKYKHFTSLEKWV